jgi:hypothetical protein
MHILYNFSVAHVCGLYINKVSTVTYNATRVMPIWAEKVDKLARSNPW